MAGTTWQLTESGPSTDYMIYFLIATPDLNGFPIKKIIGQHGYKDRNTARNAIESEKSRIKLDGLPSPEFVFLSAYIVRQNGELKALEDGSTHIDFVNAGGGGSASGTANVAADVNTDTTNFNGQLSTTDTTVQTALETLNHIKLLKIAHPATGTLSVDNMSGTIISNYGQTVENTITLDTCVDELNFLFQIEATGVGDVHIKAGSTDKFYFDGVALDDGDKITCTAPAIGDYIAIWVIQTGASSFDWLAESGRGTFSDGGA